MCNIKLQLLEKSKIFYHGSPYKLEYLKEGCDFTPYKELAIAFGSKPVSLSVDENNIYFNPSTATVYLYQIDEVIPVEFNIIAFLSLSRPITLLPL